jgi:glutamate-1-semialdehyde 2,1-aminomutase
LEWFKGDKRESLLAKMRLGMLVHGIDLKGWRGGIVSAAHTGHDVEWTLDAWRKTLRALKDEGDLAPVMAAAR